MSFGFKPQRDLRRRGYEMASKVFYFSYLPTACRQVADREVYSNYIG
jgi:hypothetical protein